MRALLAGCYHPGVQPRTGEVPGRGRVTAGGSLTPVTYAPGQVVDAEGERFTGFIAAVPYVVLDASRAEGWCNGCVDPMVDTFDTDWGVSLVVGGRVLP